MRRNRFYHDGALGVGAHVDLSDAASHHLGRVLRARVNDELILFNGLSHTDPNQPPGEFLAHIITLSKRSITVCIDAFIPRQAESPLLLHLAQGIARGDKMDWILQKAVELGVTAITPLMTQHGDVRLHAEQRLKRETHWRAVIQSAAEQSGRLCLPTLHPISEFGDFIQTDHAGVMVICHPHTDGGWHGVERDLNAQTSPHITVCIGPEGGFSDDEIHRAEQAHAHILQLGPRILRTETAGLAMLAILQQRYGDYA